MAVAKRWTGTEWELAQLKIRTSEGIWENVVGVGEDSRVAQWHSFSSTAGEALWPHGVNPTLTASNVAVVFFEGLIGQGTSPNSNNATRIPNGSTATLELHSHIESDRNNNVVFTSAPVTFNSSAPGSRGTWYSFNLPITDTIYLISDRTLFYIRFSNWSTSNRIYILNSRSNQVLGALLVAILLP